MTKQVILVVGPSGVGKSTLCSQAAETGHVAHILASSFARVTAGVDSDQLSITKAIRHKAEMCKESTVIVDGHIVLKGAKIPKTAVKVLDPSAIIVVTDDVEAVASRRSLDTTRTRQNESTEIIAQDQDLEVRYAQELAASLGIRLAVLERPDWKVFSAALNEVIEPNDI